MELLLQAVAVLQASRGRPTCHASHVARLRAQGILHRSIAAPHEPSVIEGIRCVYVQGSRGRQCAHS